MNERLGTLSRFHGHDVHVRFSDQTFAALKAFAAQSGLALNGCVRLLVERQLALEAGRPPGELGEELLEQVRAVGQVALAGLVAVEQNQRLLVAIVPNGQELCARLLEESAAGARRRLLRLEEAVEEEVG